MSHPAKPIHEVVLDQMYRNPEMFSHLSKAEYVRMLIEDIQMYRAALGSFADAVGALVVAEENAKRWGTGYLRVDFNGPGPVYAAVDMSRVTITFTPRR